MVMGRVMALLQIQVGTGMLSRTTVFVLIFIFIHIVYVLTHLLGAGAAQVVPHVHFHIVPRPPLGQASTSAKMSFIMFGRGQREDLDDEEAEDLVRLLREEIAREVARVKEVEGIDLEGEFEDAESGVAGGKGRL